MIGRPQYKMLVGVVAVVGLLLLGSSLVSAQGAFAHGTVVALQDTPHLWIADERGVLHWAGDTRALAGRHVNWGNRVELSLEQLQRVPRGDPWLSAGLLKDGDPIYLVKWETNEAVPRLLHILSILDVQLFGINESNYGRMVIHRSEWEAHYGIRVSDLARTNLAPAATVVMTPASDSEAMLLTEWPPVAQKHLGFTIPSGWGRSAHEWPLGQTNVRNRNTTLDGFPLPGTAIVTTLRRTDDVLSVLAVSEKDYAEVTAERLRDRLLAAAEEKIRVDLRRFIKLELTIGKKVTQTTTGVPVWRAQLRYQFDVSEIRTYFAHVEYRVLQRGNVFWIIEHSRASLQRFADRADLDFQASQHDVDTFVNSLEFRY